MIFISEGLIFLTVAIVSYLILNYVFSNKRLSGIPGPKMFPLIGSYHVFLNRLGK